MPGAGGGVNDLQALVGMVSVAEDAAPGTVGSDVPGIVVDDSAYGAGSPIHHAKRVGPDGEHQVARAAEEGLVDDELVVAVLVEALESGAVERDRRRTRSIRAREGGTADGSRCAGTE